MEIDFFYSLLVVLQGAITKRMTAIEEMAGMDVLCSDKTGTLTLNKLSVDKNLIEVISSESCTFEHSSSYLFCGDMSRKKQKICNCTNGSFYSLPYQLT